MKMIRVNIHREYFLFGRNTENSTAKVAFIKLYMKGLI